MTEIAGWVSPKYADKEVKCPKCDSTDFEKVGGIVMMFD